MNRRVPRTCVVESVLACTHETRRPSPQYLIKSTDEKADSFPPQSNVFSFLPCISCLRKLLRFLMSIHLRFHSILGLCSWNRNCLFDLDKVDSEKYIVISMR